MTCSFNHTLDISNRGVGWVQCYLGIHDWKESHCSWNCSPPNVCFRPSQHTSDRLIAKRRTETNIAKRIFSKRENQKLFFLFFLSLARLMISLVTLSLLFCLFTLSLKILVNRAQYCFFIMHNRYFNKARSLHKHYHLYGYVTLMKYKYFSMRSVETESDRKNDLIIVFFGHPLLFVYRIAKYWLNFISVGVFAQFNDFMYFGTNCPHEKSISANCRLHAVIMTV